MNKRKEHTKLIMISVMAMLCAIVFAKYKSNAAKAITAEWLNSKKATAISCSPYTVKKKFNNDHVSINNTQSENKNNGNSCPHQWGASGFLCMNDPKRKKNHSC